MSAPSSFTMILNGNPNEIRFNVHIQRVDDDSRMAEFMCAWDTGCTYSCISKRVARELGILPVNTAIINTANGSMQTDTYDVNVILPTGIRISNVRVRDANADGVDVLIGMDIIGLGDSMISKQDGRLVISYRVPSLGVLDFTGKVPSAIHVDATKRNTPKLGRNDPCVCGSGRKYKECCGR